MGYIKENESRCFFLNTVYIIIGYETFSAVRVEGYLTD